MKSKQKNKRQGSSLIVAIVIVGVATAGVLAAASMVSYRSSLSEAEFLGLERRVKFNNSKALAKKALYANFIAKNVVSTANSTYALTDPSDPSDQSLWWAAATIPPIPVAPLSYDSTVRTHSTGAAPLRAFSLDLGAGAIPPVQLYDGVNNQTLQFQLKSYNPVLGGDLLSVHPSSQVTAEPIEISGNIHVAGRAVFWPATYSAAVNNDIRADEWVLPPTNAPLVNLLDTQENQVLPSNYHFYPQTTGENSFGTPYDNQLEIVANGESQINGYFARLALFTNSVTVSGTTAASDGVGPDTIPAGLNDTLLIDAIQNNPVNNTVVGELTANQPLSSAVLISALNRPLPFTSAEIVPILEAQSPLPDDVVAELAKLAARPALPTEPTLQQEDILRIMNFTQYSYATSGNGTLVVNLGSGSLPNLGIEQVDNIVLVGQPAPLGPLDNLQPRAIAIRNSDNVKVSTVRMVGETNSRRMALAISQTGVLDNSDLINVDGTPAVDQEFTRFIFNQTIDFLNWNMILETEGVSQNWNIAGVAVDLIGGIRTDHSIRVENGRLDLVRMENPEFLESLLSRNAWIETYR